MKQQQIPGIGGVLTGELIVDLFAGGGGASAGIEVAIGRPPDIAINHDPHAVQMHETNHPATTHHCQSVFHREVHPRELVKGRRVGLLWLSPDCRHFSRAKGSAPVSPTVRGLCWIGLRWAKYARPRVVVLENVPEFLTFGPLDKDGIPIKARAGEYFRAFVKEWKRYGYTVEWQKLVAADLGAPTTRKRLFLVARCDGEPIAWPEPTHGKSGKPKPWRTAAECIDWSILCPSIFERKRPLAPATCRRIARGIARYVLQGKPFIVQVGHGDHVLRPGDRCTSIDSPIGVVSQVNNRALVSAWLAKHNGGTIGQSLDEPLHTIAGHINKAVVASSLIQIGARHGGGDQPVDVPMNTLLTTERFALAAAHLSVFRQNSNGQSVDEPVPTLTAGGGRGGGSMALVAAFLVQYYSSGTQDQPLTEPMATVVSRARHGLVTVTIDGVDYAIVDIGMRMLEPRELARAQGFDDSYVLTGTKSQKIARIGNSVCPPVACAVVGANLKPRRVMAA